MISWLAYLPRESYSGGGGGTVTSCSRAGTGNESGKSLLGPEGTQVDQANNCRGSQVK